MGPMRAAYRFASGLAESGILDRVARIEAQLYGSLALTGIGHATDRAVLLGLSGNEPSTVDPAAIESSVAAIRASHTLNLAGRRAIAFDETNDLIFHRTVMNPPGAAMQHPNGLRFTAYDAGGKVLDQRTFFSIGGGFITEDAERPETAAGSDAAQPAPAIPFPFHSAAELLELAEAHHALHRGADAAQRNGAHGRAGSAVAGTWRSRRHRSHLGSDARLHGAGYGHRRHAARRPERAAAARIGWPSVCARKKQKARQAIRWRRSTG